MMEEPDGGWDDFTCDQYEAYHALLDCTPEERRLVFSRLEVAGGGATMTDEQIIELAGKHGIWGAKHIGDHVCHGDDEIVAFARELTPPPVVVTEENVEVYQQFTRRLTGVRAGEPALPTITVTDDPVGISTMSFKDVDAMLAQHRREAFEEAAKLADFQAMGASTQMSPGAVAVARHMADLAAAIRALL